MVIKDKNVMDLSTKVKIAKEIFYDVLDELSLDLSKYDEAMHNKLLETATKKLDDLNITNKASVKAIKQILIKDINSLTDYQNNSIEYGIITKYNVKRGFGFLTSLIAHPDKQVFFHISQICSSLREKLDAGISKEKVIFLWFSTKYNPKKKISVSKFWNNWKEIPEVERRWFVKWVKHLFINKLTKIASRTYYPGKKNVLIQWGGESSIGLLYFTYDQLTKLTNKELKLTKREKSEILYNLINKGIVIDKTDFMLLSIKHKAMIKKDVSIVNKYREYHRSLSEEEDFFIKEIYGIRVTNNIKKSISENIKKQELKKGLQKKAKEELERSYWEKLKGTGIKVKIDSWGRPLYYESWPGRWLSHDYVQMKIKQARKSRKSNLT